MSLVAIQDTFLESFSKLPKVEQKRTRKMIDLLRTQPDSNGLNLERCKGSLDSKVYSIRVSQHYRVVAIRPEHEDVTLLVWVDHHDEAYRWAERKRFDVNQKTGLLQMWTSVEKTPLTEESFDLFAAYTDIQLLELGVPEELLPLLRNMGTEAEFAQHQKVFPADVVEYLYFLIHDDPYEDVLELAQESKRAKPKKLTFAEAVSSPGASRHIAIITSDEQLTEMLDQPLDRWRTFLHPSQKELVEKSYKGPVRVLGGAGTGKTVVAMHRARQLVRTLLPKNEKVLVTTYTVTLANNIREILTTMCTAEEMERIDVQSIDSLAKEIVEKAYGIRVRRVSSDDTKVKAIWKQAVAEFGWNDEDLPFLKNEYERVIQQNGVETWEQYLDTTRVGRKKRISRAERKKIWDTIAWVRLTMEQKYLFEYTDVLRKARIWLEENPDRYTYVYRSAIVDEAQDFHPEGFKLIRALVPENNNDLFMVGDAHQRIYSRRVVLGRCGINIRGQRSKRLRINYRTTEQIRKKAMEFIQHLSFDDLDGGKDQGKDISLLAGAVPEIQNFAMAKQEKAFVVEKVKELIDTGFKPNEIAILARFNHIAEGYLKELGKHRIQAKKLSPNMTKAEAEVQCGTMHNSKGLEFRAVFLVEINEEHVPPEWVIEKMEDEEEKNEFIKQERSLIYVATTRAREKVFISSCGTPSKLLF
ncbi:UvrD-helicase domain-containing protein [Thermoflavimicrobium daqui]|uniref:DNA 3'-5' helicase n=1 Tax=Thermoflavimicrobium daqui TaxID=2137476 RepID=A0A364K1D5_9BACL|nr:UvrD-helicase domain-containing protein [Thermoflavimicrobium daqui]RAL21425.1 DNA helicase [Thermoflavimicrobium daqui]